MFFPTGAASGGETALLAAPRKGSSYRRGRLRDAALQNTELDENGVAIVPIRLGGSPIGSSHPEPCISDAALHAIANLAAISFERHHARAAAGEAAARARN